LLATPLGAQACEIVSASFGSADVFTSVMREATNGFPNKIPSIHTIIANYVGLGKMPYFAQIAILNQTRTHLEHIQ